MFYVYAQPYGFISLQLRELSNSVWGIASPENLVDLFLSKTPGWRATSVGIPKILIIFMHAVLAHLSLRRRV